MPRRVESIDFKASQLTERILCDRAAIAGNEQWVVLIGEGSDAEKTLNFLRDLWPDVECDTAFTRTQ